MSEPMFCVTPSELALIGDVPIPIVIEASPRTFNIAVVTKIAASLIAGGSAEIETPAV
jgi:hypothetical protein